MNSEQEPLCKRQKLDEDKLSEQPPVPHEIPPPPLPSEPDIVSNSLDEFVMEDGEINDLTISNGALALGTSSPSLHSEIDGTFEDSSSSKPASSEDSNDETVQPGIADLDIDIDEEAYELLEASSSNESARKSASTDQTNSETKQYTEYEKIVVKEIVPKSKFEVLPDGWISITHNSGMPVYLHRESRVCTMSRPYHLGPASARSHQVPVSAIPCLMYRRAKEQLAKSSDKEVNNPLFTNSNDNITASPNLVKQDAANELVKQDAANEHSVNESSQSNHSSTAVESLEPTAITDYCKSVFDFDTIHLKRFKHWKERKAHDFKCNREELEKRPNTAASNIVVIPVTNLPPEFRINAKSKTGTGMKPDLLMNPANKSSVSLLCEYVMWAMRVMPTYEFDVNNTSGNPYCCVVKINDVKYGHGTSSSKKGAKEVAALETLATLLPQHIQRIMELMNVKAVLQPQVINESIKFFDTVKVLDKRIADLSTQLGQPKPYLVLTTCLAQNFIMGDSEIFTDCQVNEGKASHSEQKVVFTMSVGAYKVTVLAKNSKNAKQLAAQEIIHKLHPQITCWGSILRLYGMHSDGSGLSNKQAKMEQNEVTSLQHKKDSVSGSQQVLAKLKEHLTELYNQRKESQSKRKFEQKNKILPFQNQSILSLVPVNSKTDCASPTRQENS